MPGALCRINPQSAISICNRLGKTDGIILPSSLYQQGDPGLEAIEQHLLGLIDQYPASFLERYGKNLQANELEAFKCLRHDFEISFWLDRLEQQTSANQRHSTGSGLGTPVVQRNRRLAAMQKLHDAGEYFSTEAMQERDPAMYDQYIGQYLRNQEQKNEDKRMAADLESRGKQEKALQFRMQEMHVQDESRIESDREDQVSEHDSDEDDAVASTSLPMERELPPRGVPLRGSAIKGIKAGGVKPTTTASKTGANSITPVSSSPPSPSPHSRALPGARSHPKHSTSAAAGSLVPPGRIPPASQELPHWTETADQRTHNAGHLSGQGPGPQMTTCSGAQPSLGSAPSMEDLQTRQNMLVEEMEAKFLSGGDPDVDYAAIDADQLLDDYWLDQQGRDAEDAWFDSDRGDGEVGGPGHGPGAGSSMEVEEMDAEVVHPSAGGRQDEDELEEWEKMAEQYGREG